MEIKVKREEILGNGASGFVFGGLWKGHEVAVKRVQLVELEFTASQREKTALQNFEHPNVIRLLCVEDDSDFRL